MIETTPNTCAVDVTAPVNSNLIKTDAVIVGAGPVGLFQVFELGLLALDAHVVDSMTQVGGQCAELYPDKPIYDIPALPVCGAQELIERLMEQIKPFNPTFHLGQTVTELQPQTDGRFIVGTSSGTVFDCGAVIIAGGLGAFLPKKLRTPGAEALEGHSLHYKVGNPEQFRDRDIVIAGGGDSALDWALNLVEIARSVVLLHRSQNFRAAPASVLKMQALCDDYRMQFLEAEIAGLEADGEQLKALLVRSRDGITRHLDAEQLLVFWGLHPKLGPIADWGLGLHKNQIEVDTEAFRTNVPGIFAVGDINTYPGKKKLILSGFHEAALAAFGVKAWLQPNEKVHLQYTTTSTALHRRLGVESQAA
jgi:thioredoxin reductase (NADPH)